MIDTIEGRTDFGNLTTFYSFIYTSAAILLIGLLLIFSDQPEAGLIFLAIGFILLIVGMIFFYMILYQVWKFTIAKEKDFGITPSIPTAGKAVGYLFIPIFNFYWLFKGIGKLPNEINSLAKRLEINKFVPDNLGYGISLLSLIGFIPYVGYVTAVINLLILVPLFIKSCVEVCKLIDKSRATTDKTTEVLKANKIEWESINEYSSLFDKEKYGINFFIGIALFVSLLITRFLKIYIIGDFEGFYIPNLDSFLNAAAFDLIISILFIIVTHLITKSWTQPFVWGAIVVFVYFFRSIVIMNAQNFPNPVTLNIPSLKIDSLIRNFIWGFAFMFGLVFAIQVWGAKIWSLIIGLIFSFIIYKAMFFALEYLPTPIEYDFDRLITGSDVLNLIGRIITALFIYAALSLHFDKLKTINQFNEPLSE